MPVGPGAPNPSGLPGFNVAGNVVLVTTGAANSVQLPSWINVITTVPITAAAAMLPPGYAGAEVVVINRGANSCTVYGYQGSPNVDTIEVSNTTTQVTTGVAVAAGARQVFLCMYGENGNTNAVNGAMWKALF